VRFAALLGETLESTQFPMTQKNKNAELKRSAFLFFLFVC